MKPIEGIELTQLIEDVNLQVRDESKRELGDKVRALIYRIRGLREAERSLENQLSKNREKREKAEAQYAKLREGDWSVLSQLKSEDEKDGSKPNGSGSLNPP